LIDPRQSTIHALFADVTARSAYATALVQPASERAITVSYRELDEWSNGIARELRARGVRPGDRVALVMNRCPGLVASMLGVLKAGAAYVPLDPSYPRARLDFVLSDSAAAACITGGNVPLREEAAVPTIVCDDIARLSDAPVEATSVPAMQADAPAYVMYTSGSTGQPKGVVVPHRAVLRLVLGQSYARFGADRVFLHMAPAAFDASTFEIWGALLHGAKCVLAPDQGVPDLAKLRDVIAANSVTTVWLTASLFNTIVDHEPNALATVDEVLTGGEALSVAHVRRAQELLPHVQLINGYGPTESTTFACCHRIPRPVPSDWRSIPIGRAIANTSAHVLDAELRTVASGEAGDLYLGGDGLALGYLNNPGLTDERFVRVTSFGRLYRTGDRARMLADGTLDFLGRLDEQVKIRGYRIEPGEIEAALRDASGISNAAVMVREDSAGDHRLVAYYTLSDCVAGPSPSALRAHLASRLPDYMVPSTFVQMPAIPITPNGKVDRRALPAPTRARPVLERPFVAPRNGLETWLASLWTEVLQLDEVGVQDRFFELGGTSIAAMRFLARLNERTKAPVPALVLFRAPTISELARIIEGEHAEALPAELAPSHSIRTASLTAARTTQRQGELAERRLRRRRAN
jgi:amino acid adenylation domain-containing protein